MLLKRKEYHQGEALLIKYYRLLCGMSQQDLAIACHFQKSFVCEIEAGKNITRDTRIVLACALKVEPWQLCKLDADWQKLIPMVEEMDRAFKEKRLAEKRKRWRRRK